MSKQAAATFVSAVKATIAHYDGEVNAYYKKFIAHDNGPAPTAHDCEELSKIIKEMQDVATVYHTTVLQSFHTFGGPSDTIIHNARILLDTLQKKAHPSARQVI